MTPLILWGGTDISPELYGQKALKTTDTPDLFRDEMECNAITEALKQKRPIIGVCRGAQLLCTINGGSLYQHSLGHNYSHGIHTQEKEYFSAVPAAHHQIMNPDGTDYEMLGWSEMSTKVWVTEEETKILDIVPEIVFWPKTKCLGIQPHPEWCTKQDFAFIAWINKQIYKYLEIPNAVF